MILMLTIIFIVFGFTIINIMSKQTKFSFSPEDKTTKVFLSFFPWILHEKTERDLKMYFFRLRTSKNTLLPPPSTVKPTIFILFFFSSETHQPINVEKIINHLCWLSFLSSPNFILILIHFHFVSFLSIITYNLFDINGRFVDIIVLGNLILLFFTQFSIQTSLSLSLSFWSVQITWIIDSDDDDCWLLYVGNDERKPLISTWNCWTTYIYKQKHNKGSKSCK